MGRKAYPEYKEKYKVTDEHLTMRTFASVQMPLFLRKVS